MRGFDPGNRHPRPITIEMVATRRDDRWPAGPRDAEAPPPFPLLVVIAGLILAAIAVVTVLLWLRSRRPRAQGEIKPP